MIQSEVLNPKVNPLTNFDLKNRIDEILELNKNKPGSLMVILNEVQAKIGFVSGPMQEYIANSMRIPVSRVHGVVTFYSFFTAEPRGTHTIKFCMGTACYVGGTPQIIDKAKQLIGVEPGQKDIAATVGQNRFTTRSQLLGKASSYIQVVFTVDGHAGTYVPGRAAQLLCPLPCFLGLGVQRE